MAETILFGDPFLAQLKTLFFINFFKPIAFTSPVKALRCQCYATLQGTR